MSNQPVYDVCFVGGGVASLYTAYRVSKKMPGARLCILEACPKLGGRAGNVTWNGASLVTGAGILRMNKDTRALELMRQLGLRPKPFAIRVRYSPTMRRTAPLRVWVKEYRRSLASPYFRRSQHTFRSWGTAVWGPKGYREFTRLAGYSDYEAADAYDTIMDYGFDDNATSGHMGTGVSWSTLISKLAQCLREARARILTNARATSLQRDSGGSGTWSVGIQKRKQPVRARVVVIGTTISSARALLPSVSLAGIRSQPFIRVYAKVKAEGMPQGFTVVPNALQKVIPMNRDAGVYMIAYADNASALRVHKHAKAGDATWFERMLEEGLGLARGSVHIEDMKFFFWKEGTHYFTPLPKQFRDRDKFLHRAQRPLSGVFLVGEGLSRNQGWVEGALASGDAVLGDVVHAATR